MLELQHFSMHYYLNCICYMTYCWVFYPFGQFLIWVFSFGFNIIPEVTDISLAIFIPACASSSPVFNMMYSTYKLSKQGGNIQP